MNFRHNGSAFSWWLLMGLWVLMITKLGHLGRKTEVDHGVMVTTIYRGFVPLVLRGDTINDGFKLSDLCDFSEFAFPVAFSIKWYRPSTKMDMTPATTIFKNFDNSTEELLENTTDSNSVYLVIKSSPSWHLSVGVAVGLAMLLLTVVMSFVILHEYVWALKDRQAKSSKKNIVSESGKCSQSWHLLCQHLRFWWGADPDGDDTDTLRVVWCWVILLAHWKR